MAKQANDFIGDVVGRTIKGIQKAHRDYYELSGGNWLWQAPEYLSTTYIFREIARITNRPFFITLEKNVRETIEDAGGLKPGRPRKLLRLDGRYDIVLWWGNGTPRAVIEVKSQVSGFSGISDDVERLCATLNGGGNGIRCGLIAYHGSFERGDRKTARERLKDRLASIANGAKDIARNDGVKCERFSGRVNKEDEGAWATEVLRFSS